MASVAARRPGARHAAGEIAFVRVDHVNAARAKLLQILLRRRMLPHVDVHGRSDDDRRFGREVKGREKIVGDALREVRENIGGGRRDEQKINSLRDGDVLDGAFDVGRLRAVARRTSR